MAAFAAQLKDTVDMDSVHDDLASVVHQALEPAHEPALLRYDWRNKEADEPTVVTNMLAELPGGGTRLTWEHTDFHGVEGMYMSRLLGRVRRKMLTEGLPAVLAGLDEHGNLRPASTLRPKD